MEHYPEIDRRDGTLFFIPNGDRAAIAISIERLIDLLDAAEGDTDLEPDLSGYAVLGGDDREGEFSDYEPTLGAPNDYRCASQEAWALVEGPDECEVENEHGGDILDEPHDEDDNEPNGDEGDYTHLSEECVNFLSSGGGGEAQQMAGDIIRGLPIAAKRLDAYLLAGGRF